MLRMAFGRERQAASSDGAEKIHAERVEEAAPAAIAHAGPWVSCWYLETPSSGVTSGRTISNALNCEATWKRAPPYSGARCIWRTSPRTTLAFSRPGATVEDFARSRNVWTDAAAMPAPRAMAIGTEIQG